MGAAAALGESCGVEAEFPLSDSASWQGKRGAALPVFSSMSFHPCLFIQLRLRERRR